MSPYGGESEPESLSVYDQRVMNLQRQLDIESKVKAGADNMIIEYSSNHKNTDKKLLSEAQQMSQVKEVRYTWDFRELMRFHLNDDSFCRTPKPKSST